MRIRTAILDYGVGNLRSVYNAVKEVGGNPGFVTVADGTVGAFADCTHIIIPGQGAFCDLPEPHRGVLNAARKAGMPILGICLGMQLMCESSEEAPGVKGLGWLPWKVERLRTTRLPHIGWNTVRSDTEDWGDFYFCHSYAVRRGAFEVPNGTTASTLYDDEVFIASYRHGNLWAVQFHPEKSGKAGLEFLRRFLNQ